MVSSDSLSLLKNRSINLFLTSRVSASLGTQMVTLAVGWQMYSLTKSALYLGLVGLFQFLPMLLLTLVVGYAADRFSRKLIICLCQASLSICFFILAFESYSGGITKEKILIIVFFIGAIYAFQGPSMQSMLPNIVSKEIFPRAAALAASAFQTAVIVGPALGGMLYSFGAPTVYLISAVLLSLSCIVTFFIHINQSQTKPAAVTLKTLLAGISFIKQKPMILGAISLDLFAVLFGGATALLPIYASNILMVGPLGLGILRSAPAVGALVMSAILTRRPIKNNAGHILFVAVGIFGLSTIIFAVSNSIVLSLIALIVLGGSDVFSVVIRSTLVQTQTPDEMRGRVNSVNQLFIGTSNQLGEFESGITAAYFGVVPAAIIGGIGTLIVVVLWIKLFPDLYNVNKLIK